MNIAGFTYKGTSPQSQQDAICINGIFSNDGSLQTSESIARCFVADGVGGSTSGSFASQYVLNQIKDFDFPNWGDSVIFLRNVNADLISQNTANRSDSATTLAGCVYNGNEWLFFQAGDSEIYLIRKSIGRLVPLVGSHNETPENIKKKFPGLSPEKIYEIAANTITSYFGGKTHLLRFDVDWQRRLALPAIKGIQPNDKILICSDGLFKSIGQKDLMEAIVNTNNVAEICTQIQQFTQQQGAPDNVSMILIDIKP